MNPETWHELSVRTRPAGGPVAREVAEGPPYFVQGRSRLVVLVHGYNDTLSAARGSYAEFGEHLGDMYGDGGSLIPELLVKFYWPGDTKLGPASFLSYSFEINDAKKSAKKLAGFLRGLHGPDGAPIQLNVVAHSLGCRVLLETIRELPRPLQQLAIHFGVVCLMAAGVQVDMVEPGERLEHTLEAPQRLLVLHSTGDRVLHYAFPLGQTAAGEGFFPTALGRFGPPPWVPGEHEAVDELDHGEYWGAEVSAYEIAKRLGLGPVRDGVRVRALPRYGSPTRDLPARDLPTYRAP